MSETLADIATIVRSKNAGPFWLTIDVFLRDDDAYALAAGSPLVDPDTIGALYRIDPASVRVFTLPNLNAIKISFPRPAVQGSLAEHDVHAGQQFVPLLSLSLD